MILKELHIMSLIVYKFIQNCVGISTWLIEFTGKYSLIQLKIIYCKAFFHGYLYFIKF